MPPGTQRYKRTKMVLPLRVWLDEQKSDASELHLAHTLDISPVGGRVGGLRIPVEPGQIIMLQHGQQKSQFRVVWSKELAPAEFHAGVECLDSGQKIWDLDLPQQPATDRGSNKHSVEAGKRLATAKAIATLAPLAALAHTGRTVSHQARQRWTAFGFLIFVLVFGLILREEKIRRPESLTIGTATPLPLPPTDLELAAMTPRPRKMVPVRKVVSPREPARPRVEVAEAPQGWVVYPVAPEANLTGKVDLKVVIGTDGRVKQVQRLSGKYLLAQAAEQAVKFWRFGHHVVDGDPVEAETRVSISFLSADAVSIRYPATKTAGMRLN
jgi:hypothetical protein